ncbi:MAG: hypothetical protein HY804_08895 [Nitrospinae bacterium]|nr:hypothetical protein [Nitrospinota bacterium]
MANKPSLKTLITDFLRGGATTGAVIECGWVMHGVATLSTVSINPARDHEPQLFRPLDQRARAALIRKMKCAW